MIGFLINLKRRIIRTYYKLQVLKYLKTEARPCVVCGNTTDFKTIFDKDRYDFPIQTQRCNQCGLVFVQPVPTDDFLERFYSTSMYRGLYKGYRKASKHFVQIDQSIERAHVWIDFIKSNIEIPPVANVLDYGCSEGTFLREYKKVNTYLKVYGVEPGSSFGEFSKENLDGLYGDIDSIDQSLTFDLVTMWHVLEHLKNPIVTLSKIQERMKENALIVIEVPNLDEYEHNIRGFHIGHLFHFNKETIKKILQLSGLSPVGIYTAGNNSMRVVATKGQKS